MPAIVKDLLLSKKFLVALLTTIGSITTYLGWDVDPEKYLLMATPLLVFIGAQGWSESAEKKAKVEQETALKLQERHQMAELKGPSVVLSTKTAEAGFTKFSLMLVAGAFAVAVCVGALVSNMACSHPGRSTLRFGQCLLDEGVLGDVLAALGKPDYKQQIKGVGLSHAPDLVTCALLAVAAQPEAGPGSGSAEPEPRALVAPEPADTLARRAREVLASQKTGQ